MAESLAALVIVVAFALAGCAGLGSESPQNEVQDVTYTIAEGEISPAVSSLDWMANVVLAEGEAVRLKLGVGLGQIRLHGSSAVNVGVQHESLQFRFDGDAGHFYRPGSFTIIRLDVWPNPHNSDARTFAWLGREAPFTGPVGSSIEASRGNLSLAPLDRMVLLTVATTVPGYSISIGSGESMELDWDLSPVMPPAEIPRGRNVEGENVTVANLERRQEWVQPLATKSVSALYAWAWTTDWGDVGVGARAGLFRGGLHILPVGETPETTSEALPGWGFGAGFGNHQWLTEVTDGTQPLQAYYWLESTDAHTTRTTDGMAAIALPLLPAEIQQ